MTNEEKELLLKDLCGRLQYGVNVEIDGYNISVLKGIDGDTISTDKGINYPPRVVKPYLRPMESMTKEEEKIFLSLSEGLSYNKDTKCVEYKTECQDFLNKHHFDYRGLIPMGLALEAKEGIYDGIYNKMEEQTNNNMMTFERLKEILKDYKHEEWRYVSIPSYICHQFVISQYPNVVVNVDYDEKREEIANLEIYSTNYNFIIYVDYKEDVFLQLLKIVCPNFNIKKEE